MKVAYVQQEYGDWLNENCYRLSKQFSTWGYEVRPFETVEEVDIKGCTVAYGNESTVHALLRKDNRYPPESLRYPYCLRRGFIDKVPVDTTLGVVRESINLPEFRSVFIQPSRSSILFEGRLVNRAEDILDLDSQPGSVPIWKSQPISWLSEYRTYFHKGNLVDMWFLRGDPTVFPDPVVLKKLIKATGEMFPLAFTLTFGVACFPERPEKIRYPTLLVGCGDIYAEETSCVSSDSLAKMALDRWAQLFQKAV